MIPAIHLPHGCFYSCPILHVVRFLVPLVIEDATLQQGLNILESAMEALG